MFDIEESVYWENNFIRLYEAASNAIILDNLRKVWDLVDPRATKIIVFLTSLLENGDTELSLDYFASINLREDELKIIIYLLHNYYQSINSTKKVNYANGVLFLQTN